jgi:hypothetical protein
LCEENLTSSEIRLSRSRLQAQGDEEAIPVVENGWAQVLSAN